jgi:hypothetical protein
MSQEPQKQQDGESHQMIGGLSYRVRVFPGVREASKERAGAYYNHKLGQRGEQLVERLASEGVELAVRAIRGTKKVQDCSAQVHVNCYSDGIIEGRIEISQLSVMGEGR